MYWYQVWYSFISLPCRYRILWYLRLVLVLCWGSHKKSSWFSDTKCNIHLYAAPSVPALYPLNIGTNNFYYKSCKHFDDHFYKSVGNPSNILTLILSVNLHKAHSGDGAFFLSFHHPLESCMFYITTALIFLVKYNQKVMKPCQPLKTKNQSTQKKRGEYKEWNGTTHIQEDKWTTPCGKGRPQGEHQVLEPPSVVRSIIN